MSNVWKKSLYTEDFFLIFFEPPAISIKKGLAMKERAVRKKYQPNISKYFNMIFTHHRKEARHEPQI